MAIRGGLFRGSLVFVHPTRTGGPTASTIGERLRFGRFTSTFRTGICRAHRRTKRHGVHSTPTTARLP